MVPQAVNRATATADPGVQASAEAAIEIRGLPAFRLEVVDLKDPVEVGGKTTYKIDVMNQGSLPGNQVEIHAIAPPQMRVLNADGPTKPKVDGQRVAFPAVDGLQPKQTLHYSVDVEAIQGAGDVRFRVEMRTATLRDPVIEEESTIIFAGAPGSMSESTPAPSPAPTAGPAPGLPPSTPPPPTVDTAPPPPKPPPAGDAGLP
jgi:hypothetical protein